MNLRTITAHLIGASAYALTLCAALTIVSGARP